MATDDGEKLLAQIPPDKAIGNKALRTLMGWDEDHYWMVRNELLDDGFIERGRGYGGSVRLVATSHDDFDQTTKEQAVGENAIAYAREAELYDPMRHVIETSWAKEHKTEPIAVVITAAQGKKQTGGRWTRPDIVSLSVRTFRYLPGKYLELVTFEVKPADTWDVTAVYEALAHLRSATHSYVVLHVPSPADPTTEKAVDDLCRVARSHGIGVIVAGDPGDYETWEEHEEAVRHEPDPQLLDDFIAIQLSADVKERISRHLH
jgi:hypothetical protein